MSKPVIKLMLDSGAYSAWTKKQPIDINQYADFVLKYKDAIFSAVNLDLIMPTDSQQAARVSWENYLYLKDKGVETMPILHCDDSVKYIDMMLKETNLIGLSSSVESMANSERWYNSIFDYLCDKDGYPIANFHAFGDTSPQALSNYPWFSSDSTTWIIAAGKAGRIFVGDSAIQFRSRMCKDKVLISEHDTGTQRTNWEDEFIRAGLNPEKCINTKMRESDIMLVRTYMNIFHFLEVEESTRSITKFTGSRSILTPPKYGPGIPMIEPMKIFFGITSSTSTRGLAVFTQLGVKNVLISNFYNEDKQWRERILPYIYDPVGTCLADEKILKELEFLQQFLLKPVPLNDLRKLYITQ